MGRPIFWPRTKRGQPYADKVLGTAPGNLLAYWQMKETSGTDADNAQGDADRDGTFDGVTLNSSTFFNGDPVGLWDNSNDFMNIWTAEMFQTAGGVFNGAEGSLNIWYKSRAASVWTDGQLDRLFVLLVDGNNNLIVSKSNTSNRITWTYESGGTLFERHKDSVSDTGWIGLGLTWSETDDEVKAYYKGVQEGATFTGLGTWAGLVSSVWATVGGAPSSAPANCPDGYEAHLAIWNTPLTAAQMLSVGTQ